MTSIIQYYEGIGSVAVIGNYSPPQCGIATFTTDLVETLSTEAPEINCWAKHLRSITARRSVSHKHFKSEDRNENKTIKRQGACCRD